MDTRVNYTLVGIYVVILFVGMVALGLWLSQGRHRKDYNLYQVYFHESVYGLTTQAPVKFNGVKVGYVENIELDSENLQRVRLTLKIEEDVPITETTVATLKTQGLTGITYIGLKALTPNAAPLKAEGDEEYPIIKTTPSFLFEITDTLRHLAANLTKVSDRVSQMMSDENQENFRKSLENIRIASGAISNNSENIDKSLQALREVLENTKKASEKFPEIVNKTDRAIERVDQAMTSLKSAGDHVQITLKEGRVVMQDFRQQTLSGANNLIHDMQHVTKNLKAVSEDLKENPSVIIRGKQLEKAGPGE